MLCLPISGLAIFFTIDYSEHPDTAVLSIADAAILNPAAKIDLQRIRRQGQCYYAYISVVEMASDAPYKNHSLLSGIRRLGINTVWNSALMDITDPKWKHFLINVLAKQAIAAGFDGFFLDTVESVELLATRFPERAEQFRTALIDFIGELKKQFPGSKIIMNRGVKIWEKCRPSIDGILFESLLQTCDLKSRQYHAVDEAESKELMKTALAAKSAGLEVYVADFVDPRDRKLAENTARLLAASGFHALITTPELDGRILAPNRESPRRILALYGNLAEDLERRIQWPADSFTAKHAQMPLEWLGYEVDYANPNSDPLQPTLSSQYAGILLDRFLQVASDRQSALADWLIQQKKQGVRIVFLGDVPVKGSEARKRLFQEFSLGGSGNSMSLPAPPQPLIVSSNMNYEAAVVYSPSLFFDIQAPPGSVIDMQMANTNANSKACRFDAVFTAPWGGMAFNPFITFRRPDFDEHWLFDPFSFFGAAFNRDAAPVPDCTTRDGLRIFFAHIDGDGFGNRSSVDPKKRSGEIVYERILRKYPYPIASSIIEAEVRGWLEGQNEGDAKELTALARKIFADPKVEAASHTFSHPFYWDPGDKEAPLYELPWLKLAPPHQVAKLDLTREITDSIQFFENQLLPPGKKVQLLFWSGNCRPTPEAIRLTRQLGIENMNGGDTIISRKHPSISKVAPRSMIWDGELQIHAMHQNENIYRERWQMDGKIDMPFFGGFAHAADGFERTELPRRLKPVNIYYHWYSGDNLVALRAVTHLYDWALERDLHSVTASDYASLARDCHGARLFSAGSSGYWLVGGAHLRTWRLPAGNGIPDIQASKGIVGYNKTNDNLYIHTDGSKAVKLVLNPNPSNGLYLVSSTADIHFTELNSKRLIFSASDLRPIKAVFATGAGRNKIRAKINDTVETLAADDQGRLSLVLPEKALVSLEVVP